MAQVAVTSMSSIPVLVEDTQTQTSSLSTAMLLREQQPPVEQEHPVIHPRHILAVQHKVQHLVIQEVFKVLRLQRNLTRTIVAVL